MIHSQTSLRLLDALLDAGPKGAHREALIRQAKISTTSFYRVADDLLAEGLLEEQAGHYILRLSHPCNFAFKLWRDQTKLLSLSPPLRSEIPALVDQIKEEFGANLLALWLHGSVVQHSLGPESDIDFLAIVRTEQDENVRATRPVQLTLLQKNDFRQDWQCGDGFLRAVLQHGLLLFDRAMAQEFYSQPFPESNPQALQERDKIQERINSRLLFYIRETAWPDAQRGLKSLAVTIARSMIEPFGEIPAGKTDLLQALQIYFGAECADAVQTCFDQVDENAGAFLRAKNELQRLQEDFRKHIDHIKRMVVAMSGAGASFEHASCDMLKVVFGDNAAGSGLRLPAGQVAIETKSLKGKFQKEHLRDLPELRPLIVVVNQLREIPLSQRPELTPAQRAVGDEEGVILLDSRELLQLHNRILLAHSDSKMAENWALQVLTHEPGDQTLI